MNFGNVAEVVHRIEDLLVTAPPPGALRSDLDSRILAGFDLLGALVTQDTGEDLAIRWQTYVAKPPSGEESGVHPSPWSGDTGRLALRSAHVQRPPLPPRRHAKTRCGGRHHRRSIAGPGAPDPELKKAPVPIAPRGADGLGGHPSTRPASGSSNSKTPLKISRPPCAICAWCPCAPWSIPSSAPCKTWPTSKASKCVWAKTTPVVGIDSDVLERLGEPILQLLVNSVVHGIESPAHRIAHGKPAQGALRVAVRPGASVVDIDVSDDGAGVQLGRVTEVAIARKLVEVGEAQHLSDEALLELVFPARLHHPQQGQRRRRARGRARRGALADKRPRRDGQCAQRPRAGHHIHHQRAHHHAVGAGPVGPLGSAVFRHSR